MIDLKIAHYRILTAQLHHSHKCVSVYVELHFAVLMHEVLPSRDFLNLCDF